MAAKESRAVESALTIRCRRDGPDGLRPELKRYSAFAARIRDIDEDIRPAH